MKQYVHPILGRVANEHEDGYYNVSLYDSWSTMSGLSGKSILAMGFIEKEEEPDTDTKWIDDALEDYKDGMMSVGSGIYDEKYIFKQAILSHLPKQWK